MKRFFDKYKISLTIMLTTILLGLLLGVQLRVVYKTNELLKEDIGQSAMYKAMLDKEKKKGRRLDRKVLKEQSKKSYLLEDKKGLENQQKLLNQKIKEARIYAGMTDVKGEGITIVLDDAQRTDLDEQTNEFSDYIIHYIDVVRVLNTLKQCGAQAISINDERILSTSAQECAGSTIMINKNKYVLPFTIKALGQADALYDGFCSSEIYGELTFFKMRADVEKSYNMTIEAGVLK